MIAPIRVAILEDHETMRWAIAQKVGALPDVQVVLEATDGVDFERKLPEVGHIHVALVDLLMPHRDGFETMRWMSRQKLRTRAIAHSFENDPRMVRRALECGARGYVCKEQPTAAMLQAFADVVSHGFHYNEHITRALRRKVAEEAALPQPHELWASLSQRQREFVLRYTAPGMKSVKAVAADMGVAKSTAETFRKDVVRKLGVSDRGDLVRMVIVNGWE